MESNFYYASYKLLVELAEGVLWIWDAVQDYHGTTANSLQLKKPDTWERYAAKQPEAAQWTVVMVLPKAVSAAAKAQDINTSM